MHDLRLLIDPLPENCTSLVERIPSTENGAGKDFSMKKRYSSEQIVAMLRDADVLLGKGMKVPEASKQLGISEQTYYRWRQKYGGMDPQMAKELRELQKENARLKKLVTEQALDMEILKEAARPN